MKINRPNLLKILNTVKPGLASKEVIEQTTSFIFTGGSVLTYNDEVSISHPVDLDLEGAVQAKEFIILLGKLNEDEVELEIVGSELHINGKKAKSGIKLQAQTCINDITAAIGQPKEWKALPENFKQAITYNLSSVGKNSQKPLLTCIYLSGDKSYSSDDYRITVSELGTIEDNLLIPGSVASELKNYDVIEYSTTDGWIHLRTEDEVIFSFRTISGNFPADKINQYVNNISGEIIKLPSNLDGALERAGIFSAVTETNEDRIQITIKDGVLSIRGEGSVGWFEEKTRIRYKDNLELWVNPTFFREILKHTDEMQIGEGLLKFNAGEFVHIIRTYVPRKD